MESVFIRPDLEGMIEHWEGFVNDPKKVKENPEGAEWARKQIEATKKQIEWEKQDEC